MSILLLPAEPNSEHKQAVAWAKTVLFTFFHENRASAVDVSTLYIKWGQFNTYCFRPLLKLYSFRGGELKLRKHVYLLLFFFLSRAETLGRGQASRACSGMADRKITIG